MTTAVETVTIARRVLKVLVRHGQYGPLEHILLGIGEVFNEDITDEKELFAIQKLACERSISNRFPSHPFASRVVANAERHLTDAEAHVVYCLTSRLNMVITDEETAEPLVDDARKLLLAVIPTLTPVQLAVSQMTVTGMWKRVLVDIFGVDGLAKILRDAVYRESCFNDQLIEQADNL